METRFEEVRLLVESYYDQQKVRQEAANRLRTIVRNRLVKEDFREPEEKKEDDKKAYGKKWNDKKIIEKLEKAKQENKIKPDYIISLIETKKKLEKFERDYKKQIVELVKDEPIFKDYLVKIRGVAGLTAANLIGHLGYCERFATISKLWRYCGLAVIDGKAEKRKKGEKIHYNPKLKTFMYKVGDCFVKQGDGYRKLYDKFKEKYKKKHPKEIPNPQYEKTGKGFKKKYTKMHIHLMAMRKVEKIFLANYWLKAREMKGLETSEPYPIAKGGHKTLIEPFTDED